MNEAQLTKLEDRLHSPRLANGKGEQAAVILTPMELTDLINANRQLNTILEADEAVVES